MKTNRRFSRDELIALIANPWAKDNDLGSRLHTFVLDSYDEGMGEHAATPEEFVRMCTLVFDEEQFLDRKRAEVVAFQRFEAMGRKFSQGDK